jgi:hypothetical protein
MKHAARADLFHHTEKRHFDREAAEDRTFSVVVPADATLADILTAAYAARMPKGSARAGCYEVQTDAGVWSSPTRSRLNPNTAIFRSWDDLEAEEEA